jgi:hypothetical protein
MTSAVHWCEWPCTLDHSQPAPLLTPESWPGFTHGDAVNRSGQGEKLAGRRQSVPHRGLVRSPSIWNQPNSLAAEPSWSEPSWSIAHGGVQVYITARARKQTGPIGGPYLPGFGEGI